MIWLKQIYKELLDFFEQQDGWDKEEIISMYCANVLSKLNCTMPIKPYDPIPPDEIQLYWGDDDPLPATLQDFAEAFFDWMIDGVCNVIRTA